MNGPEHPEYGRCVNCGRWIDKESRIGDRFCSLQCAERYRRCPGCGAYYSAAEHKEDDAYLCPHCGYRQESTEEGGPTQ